MFCKYCGKELANGTAVCPHCGRAVTDGAKKEAQAFAPFGSQPSGAPNMQQPSEQNARQDVQYGQGQYEYGQYNGQGQYGQPPRQTQPYYYYQPYQPQPPQYQPPQPKAEPQANDLAIAGFICSFFVPILGWVFGGIGLARANRRNGKGKAFSIAAIAIATVMELFYIWVLNITFG